MLIILNIWMLLHYNLSCVHVHIEIGRSYLNVVLSCVAEGHRDGEPCTIRKDPCEEESPPTKSLLHRTSVMELGESTCLLLRPGCSVMASLANPCMMPILTKM